VFFDTVFDPVLYVQWIVGIACVVRGDGHDSCGQQVVVPIECVIGAVSKHPDRSVDGERVTRDAHRRLFWRLFALGEFRCNRDL